MSDRAGARDELAVRELGGCLQALFRYTTDSLVLLDPDGVICLWNPGSEVLYGYRGDEVLGRADTLLVPADRLRETEELRRRAIEGDSPPALATERLARGGGRVAVSLSVCPLTDDDGAVVGLVEVARPLAESVAVPPSRLDEEAWEAADREIARLLVDVPSEADGTPVMVGESAPIVELRRQIDRLGPTEATVLILGESGTGKELVARCLHRASRRSRGPFVAVNCASIPRDLLESDLFGHERGAYTGAFRRKIGRLEAAAGGTVFLDEIGEMSLELQPKLLRVIEERVLTRVGGLDETALDVRFLAATNRPIEADVREGAFRADLYYRLGATRLTVPPLRERPDDIEVLSATLLERVARRHSMTPARLTTAALEALQAHAWPGNVRELANVLEQASLVRESATLDVGDIAPLLVVVGSSAEAPRADACVSLELVEAEHIRRVLDATHWHKTETARVLGIGRDTLYRKMRKHGLDG